ncbi:dihydrofolate reductase family protein [Nocardioides sp. zg-1228]|uniref:dihydrofolate reductase family protein n=1 Tax=Nocardioides sp. zg-1228 TaxID=2763008 RepID=UPI001642BB59|nr:dihydrofolate reductase family protein [Nocardioides sp. zg-1228]MBC2932054.1 dihydrofolate reductase family protein [Nocardioides sp. zg-1228]QSF57605.1 dihydrofolate reductase family protein [Nocardioides sp. zg-1228]
MRTIVITTFLSLDGVMEAPGGGDHPHAGWTFKDVEPDMAAYDIKGRETEEASALLLGRRSYDEFAPVWPSMKEFTTYNAMPKYVVSTTLEGDTVPWGEGTVSVLRSLDDVAALKETEGGEIHVHGSAQLAQGLAKAGLVDRYTLLVYPLLLGSGKRLFGESDKTRLELVEHAAYDNGILLQRYDVVH